MTAGDVRVLTAPDLEDLARAVSLIEQRGFAARLAERTAVPVQRITSFLPRAVHDRLHTLVRFAMWSCLNAAIASLPQQQNHLPSIVPLKLMSGLTGGVSGVFGLIALPIELPVTTTLIFRSIAQIARDQGEDLTQLEPRLACLQVFALSDRGLGGEPGVAYYAARAILSRLTNEAAAHLIVDHGVVESSTPVVTRLLGEISSRFGFALSERVAAGAIPVVAAVSGAAVNMLFMEHFQRIAVGHFVVRRMERKYGVAQIRSLYMKLVARAASSPTSLAGASR
jgi:hypothetical protein